MKYTHYSTGLNTSYIEIIIPLYISMPLLELLEGIQDLIGGLHDAEAPHVAGIVDPGGEGVDLTDREPGQGGEDEVEESLAQADHDVLCLEDPSLDDIPEVRR